MSSQYQRGTDLIHCGGICESLAINHGITGAEDMICTAHPADTCPREQAELAIGVDCASGSDCGAIIIGHRDADGVLTIDSAEITPRERTNG